MRWQYIKIVVRIFILITAAYAAVAVASGALFFFLIPRDYFSFFPIIGVFYWVLGIMLNYFLNRYRHKSPVVLLNTFMLFKMIKLFLTILLLVGYILHSPEQKIQFSVSTMCYFIVFSTLEIYTYYSYNKRAARNVRKK